MTDTDNRSPKGLRRLFKSSVLSRAFTLRTRKIPVSSQSDPVPHAVLGELRFATLCPKCRDVFDEWKKINTGLQDGEPRYYSLPYYTDVSSWVASAKNCALCMRLLDNLNTTNMREVAKLVSDGGKWEFDVSYESAEGSWALNIWFWDTGHSSFPFTSKVSLRPKPKIQCPRLETSTGSSSSISFAKDWLTRCVDSHSQCSKHTSLQTPTRLIELSATGVRLFITKSTPKCPPYLTLSHCWGTIESLRLKKENLASLCQDIPTELLCKTFKDALVVTRALGFRYLWIDSLCIIQNDTNDWRQESTLMSGIYGNAIANVAASHAADGLAGLFVERDVSKAKNQFVKLIDGKICELEDSGLYRRCLTDSRLSARAWVFQERFLAQRTIHFTAEQIFFECAKGAACESHPEEAPKAVLGFIDYRFPSKDDYTGWHQVVQLYSRAKLTYSKDKLVALSGVAHHFQRGTGDQYAAGLWRSELERQLCWSEVEESSHDKQESFAYRAPSWSWASVDKPVNWRLYFTNNILEPSDTTIIVQIMNVDIVPVGDDALGQLRDATLQLKCLSLINGELLDFQKHNYNELIFSLDEKDSLKGSGQTFYDSRVNENEIQGSFYFLPLLEAPDGRLSGLIVKKAEGRGRGHFRRLGAFEMRLKGTSTPELMATLLKYPNSTMDESLYEKTLEPDKNGSKQYVITLV